jgi:WD40 repeat protein
MKRMIELAERGRPHAVRAIDFSRDEESLLIGRHSEDRAHRLATIRISPVEWGTSYDSALQGAAARARYCDSYRRIVFVDERHQASLIDAAPRSGASPQHIVNRVAHISVARDRPLVALSGDRTEVWDLGAFVPVWPAQTLATEFSKPALIALSRDGSLAAVAPPSSGDLLLFELSENRVVRRFELPLDGTEQLSIDDRKRWIAAVGQGMRGCCVWNCDTGLRAGEIFCNTEQNNNTAQALHPAQDLVAFGTLVGYVVLVNLERNEIVYMERLHETRIWDLSFCLDGRLLATAGDDGSIAVMELDEMLALGMSKMNS